MQKVRSTFTVSDFIVDELNNLASELNEKKSHIVEKALNMYFDYMDEKLADSRLSKLAHGEEKLVSAKDVFKELGL
jgi:predicted DNA-binding protein